MCCIEVAIATPSPMKPLDDGDLSLQQIKMWAGNLTEWSSSPRCITTQIAKRRLDVLIGRPSNAKSKLQVVSIRRGSSLKPSGLSALKALADSCD